MRPAVRVIVLFAFTLPLPSAALLAQETSPATTHVVHVSERFAGTPDAQGLLPTATEEARIVAQHAEFGVRDPSNLESMQRHAGHIIHALDPSAIDQGPGAGYGLLRAAEGVMRHASLAAKSEGATQNITTHSPHVATSAENTVQRASQIMALAQTIQKYVESPEEAAAIFADLKTIADQLTTGVDANDDGRVGWQSGEGGLEQVAQHVGLMKGG